MPETTSFTRRAGTPGSVCRIKTSFTRTLPPAGTSNHWLFHVTNPPEKAPRAEARTAELGADRGPQQLSPGNRSNWSSLKLKSPAKAPLEHESGKIAGKIGQQETLFQTSLSKTVYYFHQQTGKLITEIFRYCQSLAMIHLPIKQPPLNAPAPNAMGPKHTVALII